jgi:hypothetical protein
MKNLTILAVLMACIGLNFSCKEEVNPTYVFPDPETTPQAVITPVEKSATSITVLIKSLYADECAYYYTQGETLSMSADEVFAQGTVLDAEDGINITIDELSPATAYTFIAAARDKFKSTVCSAVTVITASDAPESNYPKRLSFEPFERTFSDGGVAKGYIAVADLKSNSNLRFRPTHLKPAITPTEAFDHFKGLDMGTPYVVSNGGFFWDGASLSLCITDGEVKSIATQLAYPDDANGNQITAYPVRAALGQMADGTFQATWVYCIGGKPYSFPSPLDNDETTHTFMSSAPTANTPGAELWEPEQAIGGGPMLVYNGKNVAMKYYYREIMHTGGTSGQTRQPRTAVGASHDGKVMLLVCDGRGNNGSNGLTLSEMADIFVEKGMYYAINLDGGGSSAIVDYDGELSNNPSDGSERAVPTVVVLSEVE